MIKILLCCGGGFSSIVLSSKVEKEIFENNIQNVYVVEFNVDNISETTYKYDRKSL